MRSAMRAASQLPGKGPTDVGDALACDALGGGGGGGAGRPKLTWKKLT